MSISLADLRAVAIQSYVELNKGSERTIVIPMAALSRKSLLAFDDGYYDFIATIVKDNEMFHSWCHFQTSFATALGWDWQASTTKVLRHTYYSVVGDVLGVEKITIDESLWSNGSFLIAIALRFYLNDMVPQGVTPERVVNDE